MNKQLFCILIFFTLLSCQEEEFQPRSFFEITTGDYEDLLDEVQLFATIQNGARESDLEYGFLYSPSNEALSFEQTTEVTETPKNQKKFASDSEEIVEVSIDEIEIGQPYFYRAFVRAEGRTIMGEVRTFIAGQSVGVGMSSNNVVIRNNTALLGGFVAGLLKNYGRSAVDHGHVYSQTAINDDPVLEQSGVSNASLGKLEGDRSFLSNISDLDFNTEYTTKAYIQLDANTTLYSDPIQFKIRDGWRLHSTLDTDGGIREAIAVTLKDNKAYIGIGCPLQCDDALAIPDMYEFDPSLGEIEDIPPISSLPTGGRAGAAAFTINDTIYFGGGVVSFASFPTTLPEFYYFFPENESFDQWIPAGDGFYDELARSNAIAFVIGDKAYYGLGENEDGEELSDFYEFDPNKLANFENPWTPLEDLNLALEGDCSNQVNVGRKDAVAFALNGKGYILTGFADPKPLDDFWEFDPNGNDGVGAWKCLEKFPGGIRTGASAFVIGDKAYITGGVRFNNEFYTNIWEFDGTTWTEKEAFPGTPRRNAVAFSLQGKGYLATGQYRFGTNAGLKDEILSDIWKYIPEEN